MDILHGIESKALALRGSPPTGEAMSMADTAADPELPMERPLYTPPLKPSIADLRLEMGEADVDAGALFSQIVIDKAALSRHIRHALQTRSQVSLRELCQTRPLKQGLAELVAYLQLASESFKAVVDEEVSEIVEWSLSGPDGEDVWRRARLPRVIFVR